jgi:hypothetical protein
MTDTITPDIDEDEDDETYDWEPPEALVQQLATRVADQYGKGARLNQIGDHAMNGGIPEADNLEDWQQQELFEAVRNELAFRDNGRRR